MTRVPLAPIPLQDVSIVPEWVYHPEDTIKNIILEWFVGGVLDLAGEFGAVGLTLWMQLIGAFEDAGGAFAAPFVTLGADIIAGINGFNRLIVGLATATGPLAPFVVFVAWILVFLILGYAGRFLIVFGKVIWPW